MCSSAGLSAATIAWPWINLCALLQIVLWWKPSCRACYKQLKHRCECAMWVIVQGVWLRQWYSTRQSQVLYQRRDHTPTNNAQCVLHMRTEMWMSNYRYLYKSFDFYWSIQADNGKSTEDGKSNLLHINLLSWQSYNDQHLQVAFLSSTSTVIHVVYGAPTFSLRAWGSEASVCPSQARKWLACS